MNQDSSFISLENRALYSKSAETLKFYLSNNTKKSGTSSLINHGVFVSEEQWVSVETVTLNDYLKTKGIEKCNLIKIDVERGELEVLKGMVELLQQRRIDYIVLEQLAGSESQLLLQSLGYGGWLIDEENRILLGLNKVEAGHFANYLFVTSNLINEFKHHYSHLLKD